MAKYTKLNNNMDMKQAMELQISYNKDYVKHEINCKIQFSRVGWLIGWLPSL